MSKVHFISCTGGYLYPFARKVTRIKFHHSDGLYSLFPLFCRFKHKIHFRLHSFTEINVGRAELDNKLAYRLVTRIFYFHSYTMKKDPILPGVYRNYKIIAINPPDPSLMIRSNVSFNLYRAFSGINASFA